MNGQDDGVTRVFFYSQLHAIYRKMQELRQELQSFSGLQKFISSDTVLISLNITLIAANMHLKV